MLQKPVSTDNMFRNLLLPNTMLAHPARSLRRSYRGTMALPLAHAQRSDVHFPKFWHQTVASCTLVHGLDQAFLHCRLVYSGRVQTPSNYRFHTSLGRARVTSHTVNRCISSGGVLRGLSSARPILPHPRLRDQIHIRILRMIYAI